MSFLSAIGSGVTGAANKVSNNFGNLPFDVTPGFNLNTNASGVPFVGKEANANVTTAPTTPSRGSSPDLSNQVVSPTSVYTGGGSSSGGGSTTSSAGSKADVAAYTDQVNALQQLLGQLDITQNSKVGSQNQIYNDQLAELTGNYGTTKNQLGTQRTDTTTDYQKALQSINNNARNGYNSLQLLLGGTGSAGNVLAPFAVSQQASKQRGDSSSSFSRNLRDIGTAEQSADNQFNTNKTKLYNSNQTALQDLINSISSQKQNYLSQLSSAQNQLSVAKGGSYATPTANNAAIQTLMNAQNNLGNQFALTPLSADAISVDAPDLSSYQAQAAQLAQDSNQVPDGSTDAATALAALLKENQNQSSSYAY